MTRVGITIEVDGVARVTRCDCVRESSAARLIAEARIPRRYQHCDFINYTAYNEQLTKALHHATRLAESFPVVDRGLFLQGPPGVGKTHLAVAAQRQLRAPLAGGVDGVEERRADAGLLEVPDGHDRGPPRDVTISRSSTGCVPVSRSILAEPTMVWMISSVATSRESPSRMQASIIASARRKK